MAKPKARAGGMFTDLSNAKVGGGKGGSKLPGMPGPRDSAQHLVHHLHRIAFNTKHAQAHNDETMKSAQQLLDGLGNAPGFADHVDKILSDSGLGADQLPGVGAPGMGAGGPMMMPGAGPASPPQAGPPGPMMIPGR